MTDSAIKLFEDTKIRSVWDNNREEWFFSIVDVVQALTESSDAKQYIKRMRTRDQQLNFNGGTICTPVEMQAIDGKKRKIQAANTEGCFASFSLSRPKRQNRSNFGLRVSAKNA